MSADEPGPLPLVDLEPALKRLGGNRATLAQLIGIVLEEQSGTVEGLRACVAAEDLRGAFQIVHALQGSAAYVGAARAESVVRVLDEAIRAGDLAETRVHAEELAEVWPATAERLAAVALELVAPPD